ncbi:hypothetical protein [Actinomadura litoris]|uniref:hypothetical protein n=1 Tax=Actinomadura litoris TaxID=2678616 RepID=UPI001FA7F9ED|nr:hypothetical protein [Actinomadura litoris]
MSDFDADLDVALALAQERHPDAAAEQWAAFANSVAYAVHGISGGFGGPSTREHVACAPYVGRRVGFAEATQALLDPDGPIFGPITDAHRAALRSEFCFDDAPPDRRALGL